MIYRQFWDVYVVMPGNKYAQKLIQILPWPPFVVLKLSNGGVELSSGADVSVCVTSSAA